MAPVDRSSERRLSYLPALAEAFSRQGYRRTSTAALAAALETQETVLYRLWGSKKAMFLASLEHVVDRSFVAWEPLVQRADDPRNLALSILDYEASHHGEFGLYRLIFGALVEDDPEIRRALRAVYRRFHRFLEGHLSANLGERAGHVAWALIGLGHASAVARELRLLPAAGRRAMMGEMGRTLMGGL